MASSQFFDVLSDLKIGSDRIAGSPLYLFCLITLKLHPKTTDYQSGLNMYFEKSLVVHMLCSELFYFISKII